MLYVLIILLLIAIILWVMIPVKSKQKAKKHQERLDAIARIKPDLEDAFAEISKYYSFSHYITETERLMLAEKYDALDIEVKSLLNTKELKKSAEKEAFQRFHTAMSDTRTHKKINNEHFIKNELSRCSQYFDTVLAYPLDAQQREAVVSLEDNVLVISSAGSGKTMTTVGKVRYLIDVQHVPAEKILLITFEYADKPLGADASHDTVETLPLRAGYPLPRRARAALAPDGATFWAKIGP